MNNSISEQAKQDWKLLSNEVIAEGSVEPMTHKQATTAINILAHKIVTEHYKIAVFNNTQQLLSGNFDDNDVLFIIATGSGIHPEELGIMLNNKIEEYAKQYLYSM